MTEGKVRVAVVFGGRSSEHAISCVSAGSVLANLDPDRFDAVPVGIANDGSWVVGPGDPAVLAIHGRELPEVDGGADAVVLPAEPSRGIVRLDSGRAGEALSGVDVVFPVLHGAFGEDGTIQGLLEMADVPYVGAGVLASAVGMDKEFAKKLLRAEGLRVADGVVLRPGTDVGFADRDRLGLPLFVKPARAGSSMGVTRVVDPAALDAAIAAAREHDPKVLVEAGVPGREIECAVLEFPDGTVRASLPAELSYGGEFYDFESKYLDVSELDIPAKIDDETVEQLRSQAVTAFRALDVQGLARVDFFVGDDGGTITVNEVNTMPGFTPSSAFPKMWAVTGLDYRELLSVLVDTADRAGDRTALTDLGRRRGLADLHRCLRQRRRDRVGHPLQRPRPGLGRRRHGQVDRPVHDGVRRRARRARRHPAAGASSRRSPRAAATPAPARPAGNAAAQHDRRGRRRPRAHADDGRLDPPRREHAAVRRHRAVHRVQHGDAGPRPGVRRRDGAHVQWPGLRLVRVRHVRARQRDHRHDDGEQQGERHGQHERSAGESGPVRHLSRASPRGRSACG